MFWELGEFCFLSLSLFDSKLVLGGYVDIFRYTSSHGIATGLGTFGRGWIWGGTLSCLAISF